MKSERLMSAVAQAEVRDAPARARGRGAVQLWAHESLMEWLENPGADPSARKRAYLVLHQFLGHGHPNLVKAVAGAAKGWRRTPLGGNGGQQYYLWWAPKGAPPVAHLPMRDRDVLLRCVRHHDATDLALEPGTFDDYLELPIAAVERDPGTEDYPFRPEQLGAARDGATARLVKGHPGSGKTTTLLLSSRYCHGQRALYVTHSARLREEALRELAAFGPADLEIDVLTFRELVDAFSAEPDTTSVHELQNAVDRLATEAGKLRERLTGWEDRLQELFAELHAYWFGWALPIPFRSAPAASGGALSPETYLSLRKDVLGEAPARVVVRVGEHLHRTGATPELFAPLGRASAAVQACLRGDAVPKRLAGAQWIFVDEVQDLTLVEQHLIVELARAIGLSEGRCPGLIIAGDEGQTVRPTDFDWGALADLIHTRLEVRPEQHDLPGNVRSPRSIATVVNRSWELYRRLDKSARPRGISEADVDETTVGRVIICRARTDDDLDHVVSRVERAPGAAVIFPGHRVPVDVARRFPEIITAEGAKGLDHQTVAVLDAGRQIAALDALAREAREGGAGVATIRARTLADQLRVAASRATETLILLDRGEHQDFRQSIERLIQGDGRTAVDGFLGEMTPQDLVDLLDTEGTDPETLVVAYLREIEALLLDQPARALARAIQASGLLGAERSPGAVRDSSLRREVWRLRATAALLVASDEADVDAASRSYREANRYYHKAELKLAAQTATRLEHLAKAPASSATEASELLELRVKVLEEVPESGTIVRVSLARWCKRLAPVELPKSLAERRKLNQAVAAVAVALADKHPELVELAEQHLARTATRALEEGALAEALDLFRRLARRDRASEARCEEGLGDYAAASSSWEAAGELTRALACARRIPAPERALELARRTDPRAEALLEWVCRVRAVLTEPSVVPSTMLTPEERTLLEQELASVLDAKAPRPAPGRADSAPARRRRSKRPES